MNANLEKFNQKTMSSREISELTGKEHKNVLRDCDTLNENYEKMGLLKIEQGYYTHPNTGNQQYREFLLSRMQTFDLMTGYNVELRIKVNRRWEELEIRERTGGFQIPSSYSEALMLAAKQAEEIEEKDKLLQNQAPKVLFANAITSASTNITINDMAKLLRQNGIDIGQNRLYDWLVQNKYLICRKRWSKKKERYENDYMPTQRAADLEIFFVGETPIIVSSGSYIRHTVKINGKGQSYFINKFLKNKAA